MTPKRTTKYLASRIDVRYPGKRHWLRRWRTCAVVFCVLACAGWYLAVGARGRTRMLSPGPVSAAHAMWANDCNRCHTGGASREVSDTACLQCHDGPIHHANQLRVSPANSAHSARLQLISADGAHATRCAQCHTEHRGHTVLAEVTNASCVECHRDIGSAIAPGKKPEVASAVFAFDKKGGHPPFGKRNGVEMTDNTVLAFNHSVHLDPNKPTMARIGSNCTVCHESADPDPRASTAGAPWPDVRPHPAESSSVQSRRYFRPVNYDRHCSGCHPLRLSDQAYPSTVLPHAALDVLRPQFLQLAHDAPDRTAAWLNTQSKADRDKVLKKVDDVTGEETLIDPKEWAKQAVAKEFGDTFAADPVTAIEKRVVNGMSSSCSYCHKVTGDSWDVYQSKLAATTMPTAATTAPDTAPAASTEASAPATQPSPLTTVATGISQVPRRWFTRSEFDHDAHRNMKCDACHAAARSAEHATADQPTPLLMPTLESCTACHHGSAKTTATAGGACVTCHRYHDRTTEKVAEGIFTIDELRSAAPMSPRTRLEKLLHPSGGAAPTSQPATQPSEPVAVVP